MVDDALLKADNHIIRIGNFIKSSEPFLVHCNMCGREWMLRHVHCDTSCRNCSGTLPYTNERVDQLIESESLPVVRKGEVLTNLNRLLWECSECNHQWETSCYRIFIKKQYCIKCKKKSRTTKFVQKPKEKLTDEIIDQRLIDGKKNIVRMTGFTKNGDKLRWKCTNTDDKNETCNYEWDALCRNIFDLKTGCPKCNKSIPWTDEKMDEYLLLNDRPLKRIGHIIGALKKIEWECTICHEIVDHTYRKIISGGGCEECNRKKGKDDSRWTNEEVDEILKADKRKVKRIEDVKGANVSIKWKCLKCKREFKNSVHHVIYRKDGCKQCQLSHGELEVEKYLIKYHYRFKSQFKFADCKYIKPLPFDFAVFDKDDKLMCLIEYDGEQHARMPTHFCGKKIENPEKTFETIQRNDGIKNDYCTANDIKLIRIPHTSLNHIEYFLSNRMH